ncbi:hypothetical protein Ahy_A03g014807 [Arachis hypogaea]|uniref:Aminotransferase-like plant mobile domain-containing protein n=1 Tax=Arachis hypogaea TaxID=3818 RepID=A0A445DYY2_ARAHY|nr:hypothetical protein Ahy_A03g014807 [Arachis hypogaea]
MGDDPARLYRLDGVAHIAGVINDEVSTQLFADKFGNHIHIRWLPYVARLEEMGSYSWGSAALAWLYRFRPAGYDTCSWPLASRWSGYSPSYSEKGPRVQSTRLKIDMFQPRDFIWMPYSSPDVLQVVHPEALEPRHMAVWRSVTSLIYFAVVEWHQVDRVLPQFGGVQPLPRPALNIDFLMSKDERGGERWYPSALQHLHILWETRANHVLWFDVVADPGPSHAYLDWWSRHGRGSYHPSLIWGIRGTFLFLSRRHRGVLAEFPTWIESTTSLIGVGLRRELVLGHDGASVSGGDYSRLWRGRRAPVAGHEDGDLHDVDSRGRGAVGVVSPHHGVLGGEGCATGDPTAHGEAGLGEGPLGDYFVGVPSDDHTLQESTPWMSPSSTFSDFLAGVGYGGDFGGSPFLDEISAIMHDDEAARGQSQTTGTHAPLHVDLNEPPSVPPPEYFALGGTPASAHTVGSHSVVGPSSSRPVHVQPRTPVQPAPQDENKDDEIEDEEPLIQRGQRTRVPRRCFTGSHLFR